jgi:hypothetical protein
LAFTYSKLAEATVGSGGTSAITFSNIPQNYTDLLVKVSGRTNSAGVSNYIKIRFNGSGANFTEKSLGAGGASVYVFTSPGDYLAETVGGGATANTFSNSETYIPNYTSAVNKSFSTDSVAENNATTAQSALTSGLWSNTSAIFSIELALFSGSFVQYSTATLYGVRIEL